MIYAKTQSGQNLIAHPSNPHKAFCKLCGLPVYSCYNNGEWTWKHIENGKGDCMKLKPKPVILTDEEKRVNQEALDWLDEVIAAQKKQEELKKVAEQSLHK